MIQTAYKRKSKQTVTSGRNEDQNSFFRSLYIQDYRLYKAVAGFLDFTLCLKKLNNDQSRVLKHENMEKRGVTRPMAEKEASQHQKKMMKGDGMDHEKRMQMLRMHHMQTLWVYWALVILGVWLVLSPLTFSYGKSVVMPSGGRSLWISTEGRIAAMTWSDIISGILLIVFGWRSLLPNRPVSLWIACFIGVWITFAPVIFWAPTAAAYMNDTFVGALVISLTILIPGMPNMITYMKMGGEVPEGWSYNPSSWPQRWIMIVTAFMGWIVSRYLGAFQMGYIEHVWDPFFGPESEMVLNSKMSHSLPISDGAFGALAYTFEFLMGWMGAPTRWRTMPWMVTFFGILVIPLGLVHIFLVISQPVVVGHWCTFCLLAAAIMLPMIPLEVDEVIAMGQHLVKQKRKGANFWKVFWKGGDPENVTEDNRSPELIELPKHFGKVFNSSVWGMSVPPTLLISMFIGIFLMFAPGFFGVPIEKTLADVNHLGGALLIVVSVISMGEVVRRGRYLNILLALIIAITPWFFSSGYTGLAIVDAVVGIILIALAIPRGPKKESYGLWDKYIT